MLASRQSASLFYWPSQQDGASAPARLCVVGAPTDQGNAISKGTSLGAEAIRYASLNLAPPQVSGFDWGDVEKEDGIDLAAFLNRLAETAASIFDRNLRPLILGGDHSITFAPVSKLQQSRAICVIWFDAHTDFSPWSGRGGHNHKQVMRRISEMDGVRRIIQIGYRGITTGDERRLGPKIFVITSEHARVLDAQALLTLVPNDMPCYISIDIDVIDPQWAPGTSALVPDGLSPKEVCKLLRAVVQNRLVAGVDLVEVNPNLDMQSATSHLAARLLHELADSWTYQFATLLRPPF